MKTLLRLLLLLAALAASAGRAEPIVPGDDDEVIETLPGSAAERRRDRQLREQVAARPRDAAAALQLARLQLARARAEGDPRHAGRALAALAAWHDDPQPPPDIELMLATLQQHLHDFDGALARLGRVLARDPELADGWLTLATVHRVQGRYAASDAACQRLVGLGVALYGTACRIENDALRGRFDDARAALQRLLGDARGDAAQRAWLLTTLAELEQRAGMPAAAETAYRAALGAAADPYTALGYADLLLEQRRGAEVGPLLQPYPRSDAVLLRLALAEPRGGAAAELRARFEQARQRDGVASMHGREQAMFALGVERDAARAVPLARANLRTQREPIDLLVFARAARAAGDSAALAEARALLRETGLRDRRIDALL